MAEHHFALVGFGVGDVQVVRLRASGGGLVAASVLSIFFATLHGGEIVADSDDFCDIFQQAIETGDDHGCKFNGPLLAGDVRGVQSRTYQSRPV